MRSLLVPLYVAADYAEPEDAQLRRRLLKAYWSSVVDWVEHRSFDGTVNGRYRFRDFVEHGGETLVRLDAEPEPGRESQMTELTYHYHADDLPRVARDAVKWVRSEGTINGFYVEPQELVE